MLICTRLEFEMLTMVVPSKTRYIPKALDSAISKICFLVLVELPVARMSWTFWKQPIKSKRRRYRLPKGEINTRISFKNCNQHT